MTALVCSLLVGPMAGVAAAAPANDSVDHPTVISGVSGRSTGSIVSATLQYGERVGSLGGTHTSWWKWTAPSTRVGTVVFDTIGSKANAASGGGDLDTVLRIYKKVGDYYFDTFFDVLSLVGENDDYNSWWNGSYVSRVDFTPDPGATYYIQINGYYGSDPVGSVVLNWMTATWSATAGTALVVNNTLYVKPGATLSLNVRTNPTSTLPVKCEDLWGDPSYIGTKTTTTSTGFSTTTFSGVVAGSRNGEAAIDLYTYQDTACGNQIEIAHPTYVVDSAGPVVTPILSPPAGPQGWNSSDVTLTWSATDDGSGVAQYPSPTSTAVTAEGETTVQASSAVDRLGNSSPAIATVRIDSGAPTISGSRSPSPNPQGWNNTPVTVTWTCNDGRSGIATCAAPTVINGDGAAQTATGQAVDAAGNTASASVSGVNVDATPPTLSGAATTSPTAEGWYAGDVWVEWSCADALSGLAGPCPGPGVVSGEGAGLRVSAAAGDNAGNIRSVSSSPVNIDRTPPSTLATAPSDWTNSDVTVALSAVDSLSGVRSTFYRLDGAAPVEGAAVPIASEGTHSLTFWSVDRAGNVEAPTTIDVGIDTTPPSITHTVLPPANERGWNNTPATVTFQCADTLSGIATCTTAQTVSSDGRNQIASGTAIDRAGNWSADTATVNLDGTPPTITATADREPNVNGWYLGDVTVSFSCNDALSGIIDCSPAQTAGDNDSATGTATDTAGNTTSVTMSGLRVDHAPPTITGSVNSAANSRGWYSGDVVVAWTCHDDESNLAGPCPPPSTITGEGGSLSASASVADLAGNTATGTVANIKIDRTAPITTASAPTTWQRAGATVSFGAADALSGVASTQFTVDGGGAESGSSVTITTNGIHQVTFWSNDVAGNDEASKSITVMVDNSAPTISAAQAPGSNEAGWNNDSVVVSFTCSEEDGLSDLVYCPPSQTVVDDGARTTIVGTAFDGAGNSATATVTLNIDTTAPTITGAVDRPPDHDGWYNHPVGVTFSCTDALSGVDRCTPAVSLPEGTAQSVAGQTADLAGNTAATTMSGLNLDVTRPSLSGSPIASPNENDWYHDDVSVAWTCVDEVSGIHAGCPAPSVVIGEGRGLSASETVGDNAGNVTTSNSAPVNIDRTAPSTTASAPTGWSNTDVVVSLQGFDALSGIGSTSHRLDGGAVVYGTSVPITSEGVHTLTFRSVDRAGNAEVPTTIVVQVDKSGPTITHTLSPDPNSNGWNNSPVTVTFTCADGLSGIATCTVPQTVVVESQNRVVTGWTWDRAGNSTADSVAVNLDTTAPTVTATVPSATNSNGWYKDDVVATFACEDALSGVVACTPPQSLAEGRDQSATGSGTDAADNTRSTTVRAINIDKTPPTITGAPATEPNANGWYADDVVVVWTCSDALSGLAEACPASTTITGEGDALSASTSVRDLAGNTANATVSNIKIDRTSPTTNAIAPSGWQRADVPINLVATDALSDVASTGYTVDGGPPAFGSSVTITTDGVHSVSYWSTDAAGNRETPRTARVALDKIAPTITAAATTSANAAGWYKGTVTIHFTCADQAVLSGIDSCPGDQVLNSDGAGQSVTGTAADRAGNSASVTVDNLNIDRTGPQVSIVGIAPAGTYPLGGVPAATCDASDSRSGVAGGCSVVVTGGQPNGVGSFIVTATATDVAGTTTVVTATYRVLYRFDGFLQPINDTAHQVGLATSIFKGGSVVPAKFQVSKADGTVVKTNTTPQWVAPVKGSATSAAVDESIYTDPATTGDTYRWDSTASQYIYNWPTKGVATGYYERIGVRLDDGQTYFVNVGLR